MIEGYDPPVVWDDKIDMPLILFRTVIRPIWIDEFGHVNFIHYLSIADHSNWAFWNWINCPEGTMGSRNGHEFVIVETHTRYLNELALGIPIHLTTQLLNFDDKRYILFHQVWKSDEQVLAATIEIKCLGFNLKERRAKRWRPIVADRLRIIRDRQLTLGLSATAGKGIELARQ